MTKTNPPIAPCSSPDMQVPDPRPGYYYVSCIRDDGARRLVRGPWPLHADALANVQRVQEEAEDVDPRAFWYAWGTARSATDQGPGVLGPAYSSNSVE